MPIVSVIKALSMVIMFCMIMIAGNIPLRSKQFKQNQHVLSLASAFSGGLFLSVGLIHLIPEANESFDSYYKNSEKNENENEQQNVGNTQTVTSKDDEDTPHFPFTMFITVLSYSFVLMIEKVISNHKHHHHHHHHHHDHPHSHETKNDLNAISEQQKKKNSDVHDQKLHEKEITSDKKCFHLITESNKTDINQVVELMDAKDNQYKLQNINAFQIENQQDSLSKNNQKIDEDIEKVEINTSQLKKFQLSSQVSLKIDENKDSKKNNSFAPYFIQLAFGLHATLEGLAIGVQQQLGSCLAIALAVLAHKWAEGLVMGLALKKSNISLSRSAYMIALQAIMNPIGIGLGWLLSEAGDLTSGILMSISAGTFIYIATNEVIIEEFNLDRYKAQKFLIYLVGIGFISSLWEIEQLAGG